jgi:hypothetical protein
MHMKKEKYLKTNSSILENRIVLDLACHDGESTSIIHQHNPAHVYAVEVREHLVKQAQQRLPNANVDFFVGDITDPNLMTDLVAKSNTVVCLGVLYHLFDHFRFLSYILKPNIEYVLFETEMGIESLNPDICWGFESTNDILHGWMDNIHTIPNGAPNLSWILQSAEIFGFKCDWIDWYGSTRKKSRKHITSEEYINISGPDWPTYSQIISDEPIPTFVQDEIDQLLCEFTQKRMVIRLYNTKLVESIPLDLKDIYRWPADYQWKSESDLN